MTLGLPQLYRPEIVKPEYQAPSPIVRKIPARHILPSLEAPSSLEHRISAPQQIQKQMRRQQEGVTEDFVGETLEALEETEPIYENIDEERGQISVQYGELAFKVELDQDTGLARDIYMVITFGDKPPLHISAWSVYAHRNSLPRIIKDIQQRMQAAQEPDQQAAFAVDMLTYLDNERGEGIPFMDIHPP
ncbi:MAG TPA: hypothetical protein VJI15_02490 [Candidatus Nanoarchaeia archaeon]|nr:hypothetical protein [Candidatus Nanoarchaeia archaeon]